MDLLIISNAYPSKQKAYAGIFVINQYDELKKHLDVDFFYQKRTFTKGLASIMKYLVSYFRFIPFFFKKYKVIHVHFVSPLYLLAWVYKMLRPKTKIVLTIHGLDTNDLGAPGTLGKLYRKAMAKNHSLIVVGKSLAEKVQDVMGYGPDAIMSAGIDQTKFYNELPDPANRDIDFLFSGSFYEVKGVDLLIDVIKRQPHGSKLKFAFVGSGEYEAQIRALQQHYNIEIYTNMKQPEMRAIYSRARFLTLLSRNEGFGLVLVEAMYCGTPVLVSNLEQFTQQVTHGQNGYRMQEYTTDELERLMQKASELPDHEWLALSKAASKSNQDQTLAHVCQELIKIYGLAPN